MTTNLDVFASTLGPGPEDIKLDAEATYYYAAAELANVQCEHELANKRISEHNLAVAQKAQAWDDACNLDNRVYHFATPFGPDSCTRLIEVLSRWARLDISEPVEILLTSPGGDAWHGMALFDHTMALREQGLHVKITVRGTAASMAAIYLQAADERVLGPSGTLLVHKPSIEVGGTLDQIKDAQQWLDLTQERVIDIFTDRTGKTKRQVGAWFERKDSSFSAKTALTSGLIDRIG